MEIIIFYNNFIFYNHINHIIFGQRNTFPGGIYLLKINNRNTRARCEICSDLTIKIPERRHWCRSEVFIVNFEHISHLALVFLLLPLLPGFSTSSIHTK